MPNLYSCTNLDGWTAGKQNRTLKHEDRNPHFYEYADSPEQAIEQVSKLFHQRHDFDAVLVAKNATHPFGEGTPNTLGADRRQKAYNESLLSLGHGPRGEQECS